MKPKKKSFRITPVRVAAIVLLILLTGRFVFLLRTDIPTALLKGNRFVFGTKQQVIETYLTMPELQTPYLRMVTVLPFLPVVRVEQPIGAAERERRNAVFLVEKKELLEELFPATEHLTEEEKLNRLIDYLQNHIRLYDGDDRESAAYTAYGTLHDGEGACQGITLLLLQLSREAGIAGVGCRWGVLPDGEAHMRNTYAGAEIDITANIAYGYDVIRFARPGDYPGELVLR